MNLDTSTTNHSLSLVDLHKDKAQDSLGPVDQDLDLVLQAPPDKDPRLVTAHHEDQVPLALHKDWALGPVDQDLDQVLQAPPDKDWAHLVLAL